MKKGEKDQLSFLGTSEDAPKTKAAPIRMPKLEPNFGLKNDKFTQSKQEALAKLESLTTTPTIKPAPTVIPVVDDEQPTVFSISEINHAIRSMLEGSFNLIWLRGEISNFKPHSSGHFYFSLKDSKAQINAVMFRAHNSRLNFKPQDGMEVLVRGKITVYEPRGNYQIFCELMEPVGLGALQMAYEQLKKKLEAEGLFDQKRKRALPSFPTRVAIVTSPTGAAIRDMINVLSRRFKGLEITLVTATVQGVKAPDEIVAAIELANKLGGFDVMIVGRGGGSIEDLWAFNDERVCRAISASLIPTVSAVGHEIDFTLADFVADLRAPTPSAAAELIVKNVSDLSESLEDDQMRLINAMKMQIDRVREKLRHFEVRVIDPQRRIQDAALRCDELLGRLDNAWTRNLDGQRMNLELLTQRMGTPETHIDQLRQKIQMILSQLRAQSKRAIEIKTSKLEFLFGQMDSLSPFKVMDRGYALVKVGEKIVRDYTEIKKGDELTLQFARGQASATVNTIKQDGLTSSIKDEK